MTLIVKCGGPVSFFPPQTMTRLDGGLRWGSTVVASQKTRYVLTFHVRSRQRVHFTWHR